MRMPSCLVLRHTSEKQIPTFSQFFSLFFSSSSLCCCYIFKVFVVGQRVDDPETILVTGPVDDPGGQF